MAERRMFAKGITGSARFLRLKPGARLLYYDLGMAADDDGVVEAFTVLRTTGAAQEDLEALEQKGFVTVLNEDLVTYIQDWNVNNRVRRDRYRPGMYAALLEQVLGVDCLREAEEPVEEPAETPVEEESRPVVERVTTLRQNPADRVTTTWQTDDGPLTPQDRLGKERVGQDRSGQDREGKERKEKYRLSQDSPAGPRETDLLEAYRRCKARQGLPP